MKVLLALGCLLFSVVLEETPVNVLKPADKVENWRVEATEGGDCAASVEEDAIVFKVASVGKEDWHVQAVQTDLDLKDGTTYLLTFKAKSPDSRSIAVNAMIDQEDWHQIGLQEETYLGKEFKEFKTEFTASDTVSKKNRISIVLGQSKGSVYIKDLSLTAKKAK